MTPFSEDQQRTHRGTAIVKVICEIVAVLGIFACGYVFLVMTA